LELIGMAVKGSCGFPSCSISWNSQQPGQLRYVHGNAPRFIEGKHLARRRERRAAYRTLPLS